ncbi:MAG TPA: succinate dehydrogenase, hydrophobic membrane anchor protein [Thermohalobaculum sp.]|nr:succinate dehydrogenase, hydrophobic membrane anchor protein [Thermohalobaculum sp.]
MTYKTSRARVSGLGSARQGSHHWWVHRVTSVALLPLTVLFVVPFAGALGGSHEEVLALYSNPFHALVAILFIGVGFHHLMQGLQVVIEDYVHGKAWRTGLLIGNSMFCWAFGLAGVFAILKIAFTG